LPDVDVVTDGMSLPFDEHEVKEIFTSHFLEYISEEHLREKVLPYWRSLLAPRGALRAIVPDTRAMLEAVSRGGMSLSDFQFVILGGRDPTAVPHKCVFDVEGLRDLLVSSGFTNFVVNAKGRRSGRCLELEVCCVKS
jgi:predicted SAM-dependent methyltransferase